MRMNLLVPILAAGIALSGSAFGQNGTRSTAMNTTSSTTAASHGSGTLAQNTTADIQEELLLRSNPGVDNFGHNPSMVPKGD